MSTVWLLRIPLNRGKREDLRINGPVLNKRSAITSELSLRLQLPRTFKDYRHRLALIQKSGILLRPTFLNLWQRLHSRPRILKLPAKPPIKNTEIKEQLINLVATLRSINEDDFGYIYHFDTDTKGVLTYEAYYDTYVASAEDPSEFFKAKVAGMRKTAEKLQTELFTTIRAELAIYELLSALGNDNVDSLLIEVSPRYLQCPLIQKRIFEARMELRFGNQVQKAQAYLKGITKAQTWKRSKSMKRKVSYWGVRNLYDAIYSEIYKFQKDKALTQEDFDIFCSRYCIVSQDLVWVRNTKTKNVACELLLAAADNTDTTLPEYLRVNNKATLVEILDRTKAETKEYQHLLELPYVRINDWATEGLPDLQEYNSRQIEAWDLLESVNLK